MYDPVFHLKRAHKSPRLSIQRDGAGIRSFLLGIFSVFAACTVTLSLSAVAFGGCGHDQSYRILDRGETGTKGIRLAIKVEYVGGELTWTTSVPNKTCVGPSCKSSKGFRAEAAVPISARLMPFMPLANKNLFAVYESDGRHFEPLELLGSRIPGFLFSVEHPPKLDLVN